MEKSPAAAGLFIYREFMKDPLQKIIFQLTSMKIVA